MKNIIYIGFIFSLLIFTIGCKKDYLTEENHSDLTPGFFSTPEGFESGLNAAYAGLRDFYGPEEGIQGFTNVGTDEFRIANGNRTTNLANYNSQYLPNNEFSGRMWNSSYTFINTCNGLVDFGSEMTGLNEATKKQKLAEARFLRAFYYFKLVQFFGDVTLNKNFSSTPTTSAVRDKKADVYDFIIEDLKICIADLSPSPKQNNVQAGRATAAAAKHMLAKVYLTRGYSTDAVSTDFQNAFDLAKELIDQSPSLGLGLLNNYGDVHKAGNEGSQEVLLNVQYSTDLVYGGGHALNHLFVNKYENQLGERNVNDGRCYAWFRGTNWLYNVAFADKESDTRYRGSFQTVWIASKARSGTYTVKVGGAQHTLTYNFQKGDTAMIMPGYNLPLSAMQNKNYYIYTPENYTDGTIFPTMKKYLDPNRLVPNENSHRSIIVYRLAETYLIAAEAAYKLNKNDVSANYVRLLRVRSTAPGKEANMLVAPDDITLDFILDERTRELCAENLRWLDLVRTGKLLERVKAYDDYEARKNIKDYHIIRPVPQSQIDAVITGTPYPQNAGWF